MKHVPVELERDELLGPVRAHHIDGVQPGVGGAVVEGRSERQADTAIAWRPTVQSAEALRLPIDVLKGVNLAARRAAAQGLAQPLEHGLDALDQGETGVK